MKKLALLSILSALFITPTQAQETSVSIGSNTVTTKASEVKLYNFSPELLSAAQNCTPYQEDFIKNNPDLGQEIPMLGGAKMAINIDVKGYNDQKKCLFSVTHEIPGLFNTTYECAISPEKQKEIISAMQDRSTNLITETFTSYTEVNYGDGRSEKLPTQQTMTDGIFNIIWAKTIAEDCQAHTNTPSKEEQEKLADNMQKFSPEFLSALQQCQPQAEEKQFFFITEKIEIIGSENNACHLKYTDFDLYIPQAKIASIQSIEDIIALTKDKNISKYTPKYMNMGIKNELSNCLKATSYHLGASESHTRGEITIKKQISSEKLNNECILTFSNTLTNNNEKSEYKKTCRIPISQIEGLLNIEEKDILQTIEKQKLCQ